MTTGTPTQGHCVDRWRSPSHPPGLGRLFAFLLLLLPAYANSVAAQTLTFQADAVTVYSAAAAELAQKVAIRPVLADNPSNGRTVRYEGLPLAELLDAVYGKRWHGYDEIQFTCADGYSPSMPLDRIERYRAVIAVREAGRNGYTPLPRPNAAPIDPGPFFLVWDTQRDPALKSDDWISWPWQLQGIALLRAADRFPKAAPPADAGAEVKQGFLAFRQHCIRCHAVNGEGAHVGPELNVPVSVTEYWQPEWLTRFILDPRSVRADAKMVAFYAGVKQREQRVEAILAYLRAMAAHKQSPAP